MSSKKASQYLQADWPSFMSYDRSDSAIDKFYSHIEGQIAEPQSIFYRRRQIDIFLLAMAIGKESNTRMKLKKPSNSIRCDALTEQEVWMMCAVVMSEDAADLNVLADPKQIIAICQEYANGGIKMLMHIDQKFNTDNQQYEDFLEDALRKFCQK